MDDGRGEAAGGGGGFVARIGTWVAQPGAGIFLLGAALAFAVLGASEQIGRAVRTMKQDNVIRVKGVAELEVTSDRGAWWGTVRARAATLPAEYDVLAKATDALKAFVLAKGVPATAITVASVGIVREMKKDEDGDDTNQVEQYALTRRLGVTSPDVQVVREIANGATALIQQGVEVESDAPSYTVSTIEQTKLTLLEQATANAYERAQVLARGSGSTVGGLVSAAQGVYQIVARGSTSGNDYGEYNTASIDKTARVVVTLEYAVK
ncbi:MAG: SIMPL domain-containing protein [Planctomycetota bacterium]